jgi:hypothetical protein
MKHTSRKGWLARWDCYPDNPFLNDIDTFAWPTTRGPMPLREIAGRITRRFWHSIRRISDPFTFRLIGSVMRGRAPSLLDLDDRPPEYEDVGRLCNWNDLFPPSELERSRYERILIHAIAGRRLRMAGAWYTPGAGRHAVFLEVLPDNRVLAAWLTHDPQGNQAWFGGDGRIVDDVAIIEARRGQAGRWPSSDDPEAYHNEPWGTLAFSFSDCNHGRVHYTAYREGWGMGHVDLARLTLPAGLACDAP